MLALKIAPRSQQANQIGTVILILQRAPLVNASCICVQQLGFWLQAVAGVSHSVDRLCTASAQWEQLDLMSALCLWRGKQYVESNISATSGLPYQL